MAVIDNKIAGYGRVLAGDTQELKNTGKTDLGGDEQKSALCNAMLWTGFWEPGTSI
jgi:hypothetical protein